MKFSTKTTYGIRAMILLAHHFDGSSLSLSKIAQTEDLSQKYLERLFASLKKAGLVISEKGANGGYRLKAHPKDISMYDIIKALEGKLSFFHCINEDGQVACSQKCRCGATKVLVAVQSSVIKALKNISLQSLIK